MSSFFPHRFQNKYGELLTQIFQGLLDALFKLIPEDLKHYYGTPY